MAANPFQRRLDGLRATQKKMGENRKKRAADIAAQVGSTLIDADGDITVFGSLASRNNVTRAYIDTTDGVSINTSTWGEVSGTGSEIDVTSKSMSGLDSSDKVLVLVSYNAPSLTATTYKIWSKQDFEYELMGTVVASDTEQTEKVGSFHQLQSLSDGLQPMVVNLKDTVTNCNLYGGGTGDTFTGIAQIFQTTAGMDGMELGAVAFWVSYTGTVGILQQTAYLYDSDGSTVGTNLLATSTSVTDLMNPLILYGGQDWMRWTFPTPYTLTGSTNYAIVVTRSARSTSDYWNFYEGPAKADAVALKRSSDTWGAVTGISDFAFKLYCTQTTGDWTWKVTGDSSAATEMKCSLDLLAIRR